SRSPSKMLLGDRNGFWLLMKRLEQDRFVRPRKEAVLKLRTEQLHGLPEGIDMETMRAHPTRYYQRVT
ncbi:IS66 family insertion sequence element accessory protein TnpB, partial [Paraburkholderia sp. RL17-373-BIF-A]|uniref:IS66 family insertion sequence element accessory protein TnpB n=1 Tax=Paraburkholderia sp. RL17-373-BIF-A TaxID=3031629 RepID=UPI0038BBDBCE